MPNFGPGAGAAADAGTAHTFEALVGDLDHTLSRLKREIISRQALDRLAPHAGDIVTEELTVWIGYRDDVFEADAADVIPTPNLAPLVEPIRRRGARNATRLVEDLFAGAENLLHFCQPPAQEADDGQPKPESPAAPGHGILAALQQRGVARGGAGAGHDDARP
jgi:hypothetical protein